MASTFFVDGTTPIVAAWLNDVNKAIYTGVFPTLSTFTIGGLSYSDTGVGFSFGTSLNGYVQDIVQNTSAGTAASADYIVSNNLGTATTYYGDFGINSSTFSGTGSLSLPNATYLYSANGDLVLGTQTSNAIHFVVNNGAADVMTISTGGTVTINAPSTNAATLLVNQWSGGNFQYGFYLTGSDANGTQIGIANTNASGQAAINLSGNNGTRYGYFSMGGTNFQMVAQDATTALLFGTNNTTRMTISNAGGVTINAPSSGTALSITGTTSTVVNITTPSGGSNACLNMTDSVMTLQVFAYSIGNTAIFRTLGAQGIEFDTNSTNRMSIGSAGNVTINAPASGTAVSITGASAALPLYLVASGGAAGIRIDGANSTGAATPTLANNKPGSNSSTATWLLVSLGGTNYYIPAWT